MRTLILVFPFLLSGCSVIGTAIEHAANANDTAVQSSLFTLCRGASIGSIRREFNTPEKAQTYSELCGESQQTLEKIVK